MTTFPYLKIARETGMPYADVVQIAELAGKLRGLIPQLIITGLEKKVLLRHPKDHPAIAAISRAVDAEEARRNLLPAEK